MKLGGIELNSKLGGLELINKSASSLPQDLASAFGAINSELLGATYTPLWLVGSQVVNGLNYFLVCKEIRSTAKQNTSIVCLVINIPPASIGGEGAKLVEIIEEAELPAEVETAFHEATKQLCGVAYKPICYIGSQVVRGLNYYVLCEGRVIYPGAQPEAYMLCFNVFQEKTSIVSIEKIED